MARRDLVLASLLALGAAGVTGAATWAWFDWFPAGRSLPGTYIGGRMQGQGEALGDFLELRRRELLGREAYLALPEGEGSVETTFGELGIELDVAKTLAAVREHAEQGSFAERVVRARNARRGEIDLPLYWSFDPNRAKGVLAKLAPDVWRDPVDARLDLGAHARIDDQPGRELDLDGTLTLIEQGEREELAVIPIATHPVPAQVTTQMLAEVDVTKVLSSFESNFGGTGRGRAINIATAARYLDGTVIGPGQTVSFNELVGPRRTDRGFVMAPVIRDDELEPGVGGGTCQVASTVHAAAVYGLLDVLARRSHSRPSGYVPLGLDATVIWGEVDLKFRNPYPTPLILHAVLSSPTKLKVELLGREAPGKVQHTYAVIKAHDFYRRVWTKPFVKPGKTVKRQRGIKGYDVVSVVKLERPDGTTDEKRYFSWYRPVPEVFWVPPGMDLAELPALPEGAEHVEIDGVSQGGTSAAVEAPAGEDPSRGG